MSMCINFHYGFLALITCSVLAGCMPVQLSERELVGSWRAATECGIESLELKADTTYTQYIDFDGTGGSVSHNGTWAVIPRSSSLSGGKLILKDALEFCSILGKRLPRPERGERQLETVWEWGRVLLSFNPDKQGFERQ